MVALKNQPERRCELNVNKILAFFTDFFGPRLAQIVVNGVESETFALVDMVFQNVQRFSERNGRDESKFADDLSDSKYYDENM